jgi:diaminohydroxyphosphoribosylaminopyrimidine deaminase/5-amino-6-(5-phosphoribosylamino)uracil reductase
MEEDETSERNRVFLESNEKWMMGRLNWPRKDAALPVLIRCVGAVIVNNGKVVGEGFYAKFGARMLSHGAGTGGLGRPRCGFVCQSRAGCFFGKTPPLWTPIINASLREVFIGCN